MDGAASKTWNRVKSWFVENAMHMSASFLPDADAAPVRPGGGYLRVFLAEGFLERSTAWGMDRFPALHGGVTLNSLGTRSATFTSLTRPPEKWTVPGKQLDFPITPLLPFNGGTVEVEGALYSASADGPLGTAVDLLGGLASLAGAPLAPAVMILDQLSAGLDRVLEATGSQPVLAAHWTLVAPGGNGQQLRPGHLVVAAAEVDALPGDLVMKSGRVHLSAHGRTQPLDGVDYLVLRVECRTERDDWRFPELDELMRLAGESYIRGQQESYEDRRTEAMAKAWGSPDLTPVDRKRVALLVKEELDSLTELGAVPRGGWNLDEAAAERLPSADDDRLPGLRLADLLG